MAQAKSGDRVRIHYTGKFEDGTIFDSSEGKDPIEFTIGSSEVVRGFENGIVGMVVSGKKTVNVKAADGYGPYREDLVMQVSRNEITKDIKLVNGKQLELTNPDGLVKRFIVLEFDDNKVVLDGNHPLAGKDLIFDLILEAII